MKSKQIVLYVNDVMEITGRSLRWSQQILRDIKKKNGKSKSQLVNIVEFCEHMKMSVKDVKQLMNVWVLMFFYNDSLDNLGWIFS